MNCDPCYVPRLRHRLNLCRVYFPIVLVPIAMRFSQEANILPLDHELRSNIARGSDGASGQPVSSRYTHASRRREPNWADLEGFADFLHVSLNHNITLADRKAGILFTIVSAALFYLLESRPPGLDLTTLSKELLLWAFMMALLLIAAGSAVAVVFPRIRYGGSSLLFWGRIGRITDPEEWIGVLHKVSGQRLIAAKLRHCHVLSRIARDKFRMLQVAMVSGITGLLCFVGFSFA